MPHSRERALTPPARPWRRALTRGLAAAVIVVVAGASLPPAAHAVSIRDLVALSQAGLSDDILVALIEADGGDFALDGPRILELRDRGLSERVILAMLDATREHRTGPATEAEAWPPPPPDPNDGAPIFVIIGERPERPPPPRREVILVPWFPVVTPVLPGPPAPVIAPEQRGFGRFMNDGWTHQKPASTR